MGSKAGRRARRALVGVLLVVGAAGCGGGERTEGAAKAAETTETSLPTTTTTRVVACEAGDLDPRTLAPVMVEEVSGLRREADDVGETGPSDLAKAIRDDGARDAERVLNETGFRAGYQRLWSDEAGDELVLFVYEFCKPDGAEQYGSRTIKLFEGLGVPVRPIVGAEVGTGFTMENESGRGLWLWQTSGPVLVQVATFSEDLRDPAALMRRATEVLSSQLERLRPDESGAI